MSDTQSKTTAWDGRPVNPERDGWHWLKAGDMPFLARYTWDAYSGTGSWREALNGEPLRLRFGGFGYAGPAVMPGENSPATDDDALAAELAADPAIAASLAEWECTSGPALRERLAQAWDGRGVPAHVSGYHWVRRIDVPGHDMPPVIWTWRADAQVWRWGHREMQPAEMASHMEWMGRVAAHNVAHDLASMVREVERLRRLMSEIVTRCDPGILGTADRGVAYAVALAKEGLANG